MAKKNTSLIDNLRKRGGSSLSKQLGGLSGGRGRKSAKGGSKAVQGAIGELRGVASGLGDRVSGGPAKRKASARKGQATRRGGAAKRSASARKGARTRAKSR